VGGSVYVLVLAWRGNISAPWDGVRNRSKAKRGGEKARFAVSNLDRARRKTSSRTEHGSGIRRWGSVGGRTSSRASRERLPPGQVPIDIPAQRGGHGYRPLSNMGVATGTGRCLLKGEACGWVEHPRRFEGPSLLRGIRGGGSGRLGKSKARFSVQCR